MDNNEQNSILFYKVYHNLYLKRLILKYVRLYNIFSSIREFEPLDTLNQFQFKSYLSHIKFTIYQDSREIFKQLYQILPSNVSALDINYKLPHRQSKANYTTKDLLGHIQPNYHIIEVPPWINSVRVIDYYDVPNYIKFASNPISTIHTLEAQLPEILPDCLPNTLTSLTIPKYSWKIKKDTLPVNLKSLYVVFNEFINHINWDEEDIDIDNQDGNGCILIEKGSLPNTLTDLKIGGWFNWQVTGGTFPSSLQYLSISSKCSIQLFDNYFPDSITSLNIQLQELKIKLPNSLKRLIISIDKELAPDYQLPQSIEYLDIDTAKVITHKNIPSSCLSDLIFGYGLDAPLIDLYGLPIIPKSVSSIKFGFFFNQVLDPVVFSGCRNLKSITFGLNFNQRIAHNVLPETITYLSFKNFDNGGFSLVEDNFRFPEYLKYIDFGIMFDQVIGTNTFSKSGHLNTIKFGSAFKQQIQDDSIPSSVTLIEFANSSYPHSFKLVDPVNTRVMLKIFKKVILQSPFKDLITSIEYSDNGYFENLNEAHFQSFPVTLKHLLLPLDFNQPIKMLSLTNKSQLEYLGFYFSFNQPLLKEDLPSINSIKVLVLGEDFNQEIHLEYFKHLERLRCYGQPTLIPTKLNQNNTASTFIQDYKNNNNCNEYSTDQDDYNFYNLKIIETPVDNSRFINSLNPIYFKFIQLLKPAF